MLTRVVGSGFLIGADPWFWVRAGGTPFPNSPPPPDSHSGPIEAG